MSSQKNNNPQKVYFVVKGNGQDLIANPIPKAKMTKGQQWTEKAQRYAAWKHYVVGTVIEQMRGTEWEAMIIRMIGLHGKPFTTKEQKPAKMDLLIHWADRKNGDPENIFGSMADALFKQDKYLIGSFDYIHDGGGFVEVTITLLDYPRS